MARQFTVKGLKVLGFGLFFVLLLLARSSWQQTPSGGPAYLVKDINTVPLSNAYVFPDETIVSNFGGRHLFWAKDDEHGEEPWITDGTPQGTYLLRDIYVGKEWSTRVPSLFWQLNEVAIFDACDEEHGVELWRTDGTPEGTILLKDINEGYDYYQDISSRPTDFFPARLTLDGEEKNVILFSAYSSEYGRELHITDGTPAGTRLIKDVTPGPDPSGWYTGMNDPLFQHEGMVYFSNWKSASSSTRGLWRTDGTAEGTQQVKNCGLGCYYRNFVFWEGAIYFEEGPESFNPFQQWKIDPQTGQAELVDPPLLRGATSPWKLRGSYIFLWNDGIHGTELWKSDGTVAGSEMIFDISPDKQWPRRRILCIIDEILYFYADDKNHGTELWKTDGTADGTQLVIDFFEGPGGLFDNWIYDGFLECNGKMFFVIQGWPGWKLYVSDGTASGTGLLQDGICDWGGDGHIVGFGKEIGKTDSFVYFAGLHDALGVELWRTDGTRAGTHLVEDIYRGEGSSFPMIVSTFGDKLLFTADDNDHGRELWQSDGSHPGTFMVKDICVEGSYSSNPVIFGGVDSGLIFTAWDKKHGQELWKSNGTEMGTRLLRDICPGPDSGGWPDGGPSSSSREIRPPKDLRDERLDGFPPTTPYRQDESGSQEPCLLNGEIFFAARSRNLQMELWKTNGIATTMVKDINTGREGSWPRHKISFKNQVFFTAFTEENGWELWKSDGTPPGTGLLKDINPGPAWSYPWYYVQLGDWLYFRADDGVHGFELWRTDGTESGTQLVCDVVPGADSGFGWQTPYSIIGYGPQPIVEGGLIYFGANVSSQGGYELWRSDGTTAGTFCVKDIYPGPTGSGATDFVGYNGKLIFAAIEPQHGFEIWISDGTEWGTSLVADLAPGPDYGLSPWHDQAYDGPRFKKSGDWVYFMSNQLLNKTYAFAGELWKTDGTALGTQLVKDIFPGKDDYFGAFFVSLPAQLTDVDGVLLFSADDGIHGRELWRSDGTGAGTYMIQDIYPNPWDSYPEQMMKFGQLVFFTAEDDRGYELWAMPIEAVGAAATNAVTGKR